MSLIKIYDSLDRKKIISIIFIASTLFFIYQHATGISWDFSAYVLNTKYWLGESSYFEWMRPPLTSFTMLLLSAFGWPLTEYVFIVFVSVLFLGACLEFSKVFDIDAMLLYALMLTPLVLNLGFSDGSELLTLSLLMLSVSVVYSHIDSPLKKGFLFGFFMALIVLCRYDNVIFLPLILFRKPDKRMLKEVLISACVFLLVVSPWLAYNQLATGSWLTSIADLYAINLKFRPSVTPDILHVIAGLGYYLPFFILGMAHVFKKMKARDLALLFIFVVVLGSYVFKTTKTPRYMFNLALPLAWFSIYFIQSIKFPDIIKRMTILILSLNLLLAIVFFFPITEPYVYRRVAFNLDDCKVQSNAWVFLNYYGKTAEPHPWDSNVDENIDKGYRVLLFRTIGEPEYARDEAFLSQFPIIENSTKYILLGNSDVCLPPETYTKTYLEHYIENNDRIDSVTNCEIFFSSQVCDEYSILRELLN